MNLNMTQEKSDALMRAGTFQVTSDITVDTANTANFVRKLNKASEALELFRSGWGRLAEQGTGSYGQN